MTEQEAEVLAARLTRVWKPKQLKDIEKTLYPECVYFAFIENNVALEVDDVEGTLFFFLSIHSFEGDNYLGRLTTYPSGQVEVDEGLNAYIPLFRRGCWLSGCDIEATAHEKVEWMQGFGREEIEAWNLKT